MTNSDLISDFSQLVEKSFDLDGLWKAKAYDEVVALHTRLTNGVTAASGADRRQLLLEMTQRAKAAQGSVSTFLSGLIVARLICSQQDGWNMRRGMLATPTDDTLDQLAELEQRLAAKSSAGALFTQALHQFWSGNRVGGFAAFKALEVNPDFKALVRDDLRGALTCNPDALAETNTSTATRPTLQFISSCSDTASSIALATFDDIYFKAFARRLLETANQAGDAKLHFHIVNPSQESFTLARELAALGRSRKSSVGISYEHQQIKDRATLACARFVVLEDLLRHYGQGLFVTDADLFYRRPFGDLMRVLDQSRISLAIQSDPRGSGYLPWRTVSAGYLFVPYTEAGVLFSQRVANAIHRSWQDGSNWWVDQTALYCAFNQFGEQYGEDDIAMLPSDIHVALPTSEAYKIKMISEVSEVGAAMSAGMHWNAALHSVQTRPQANAEFSHGLGAKLRLSSLAMFGRKQPPPPAPNPPPVSVLKKAAEAAISTTDTTKQPPTMDAYKISADEMTPPKIHVPATITTRMLSYEGTSIMRISGGDMSATSGGRTGGLSIRVPDEFESSVSANRVKVEVVAKSALAGPAKFSVAYSTAEVGNSGWRAFTAGLSFETHRFEWEVPQMKNGNGDFVGLLPRVGDAIDVKFVRVEVMR